MPRYGAAGASVSSTVSYSLAALLLLAVFVRETGYTVGDAVLFRRADLGTIIKAAQAARRRAA